MKAGTITEGSGDIFPGGDAREGSYGETAM
jgi:hypothetical protein